MYFNAGLIPMFITMKNLHLTNNSWVYILPAVVQPFNIILVKTTSNPFLHHCRKPPRSTAQAR